ncbi:uncharacterized protein LAJ45_02677 [Morchella importuna]|uniref:uncharacterized protein n=1 Tax=Morchella importuna TaxID=1174673 RepID=UPI001E8D9CEC|nr:uncharacterized protein LAJ45_02677 [Morchella importuna]KAH8153090.1 hypothetical protein LAJ45_02677 [Morchella importuna]
MSHSKRNTSLAFFTSYERSLLKGDYGKQRTRLTRDSFKPLDACNLCLQRCRDPVSCDHGDLFCRECAVENLLSQHKEIKRMQAELDRRIKEEEEERERGDEEAKERAVKDFELLQMGLEIRTRSERELNPRAIFGMGPPKVVGREGGKIILEEHEGDEEAAEAGAEEEGKRGKKRKFELDEEELMRLAREERQKAKIHINNEKSVASIQKLPSFWVPSLTPSVAASDVPKKPLKLNPVCPASEKNKIHNYNLKTLITVQFAEEKDERTKHGDPQRVCPSCKKGLNNATKAMLAKPCGHVLCKPCADKFLCPQNDDPHDTSAKVVTCYVCDEVLSEVVGKKAKKSKKSGVKPGLVLIQSDGTGFSAGGGNVTTEKEGIAFQC